MSAREDSLLDGTMTVGELLKRYAAALAAERQLCDRLASRLRVSTELLIEVDPRTIDQNNEALAAHAERRKA